MQRAPSRSASSIYAKIIRLRFLGVALLGEAKQESPVRRSFYLRQRLPRRPFGAGRSNALVLSEIVNGQGRLNFSGPALQGGEDSVLGFVVLLVRLGFELERQTVGFVGAKSSQ
jgi:hypothetical protein